MKLQNIKHNSGKQIMSDESFHGGPDRNLWGHGSGDGLPVPDSQDLDASTRHVWTVMGLYCQSTSLLLGMLM